MPTVSRPVPRGARWTAALVVVEFGTGVAALIGGSLLVAAPDGSLLHADAAVLSGSPFADWQIPGVLLMTLVGAGYLIAGIGELRGWRRAASLSVFAGLGLVSFEAAEWLWIGPQPLEFVFAAVGLAVALLSPPRLSIARPAASTTARTHRHRVLPPGEPFERRGENLHEVDVHRNVGDADLVAPSLQLIDDGGGMPGQQGQ